MGNLSSNVKDCKFNNLHMCKQWVPGSIFEPGYEANCNLCTVKDPVCDVKTSANFRDGQLVIMRISAKHCEFMCLI